MNSPIYKYNWHYSVICLALLCSCNSDDTKSSETENNETSGDASSEVSDGGDVLDGEKNDATEPEDTGSDNTDASAPDANDTGASDSGETNLHPQQFSGKVTDENGKGLEGVTVRIFGSDKVGNEIKTFTTANGDFVLKEIPVLAPRYIIEAEKSGYIKNHSGEFDAETGTGDTHITLRADVPANELYKTTLMVKAAYFLERKVHSDAKPVEPAETAVRDPKLYPPEVLPYLEAGDGIDINDPNVITAAETILRWIPDEKMSDETRVARGIYEWVVQNITYDLIDRFPDDVTTGQWQTTFGAFSNEFYTWSKPAAQTLKVERAICIEFERLTTALLRVLDIPARPAPLFAHPVTQWWVQLPDGSGYWANMETSRGSTAYEATGDIGAFFPSVPDQQIAFWSPTPSAPMHMRWDSENPVLFREDYGEQKAFALSETGYESAGNFYDSIDDYGYIPNALEDVPVPEPIEGEEHYMVYTRGMQIYLANIGEQKELIFSFPKFIESDSMHVLDMKIWTNQKGWLKETWFEDEESRETKQKLTWLKARFELDGSSIRHAECGDGACELSERPEMPDECLQDCAKGEAECGDSICDYDVEWSGPKACPEDCPNSPCGDGVCDEVERNDPSLCPPDCG